MLQMQDYAKEKRHWKEEWKKVSQKGLFFPQLVDFFVVFFFFNNHRSAKWTQLYFFSFFLAVFYPCTTNSLLESLFHYLQDAWHPRPDCLVSRDCRQLQGTAAPHTNIHATDSCITALSRRTLEKLQSFKLLTAARPCDAYHTTAPKNRWQLCNVKSYLVQNSRQLYNVVITRLFNNLLTPEEQNCFFDALDSCSNKSFEHYNGLHLDIYL